LSSCPGNPGTQNSPQLYYPIDAKSATTGISALERSECISLLSSPIAKRDDFVRPGHIFPLIAKRWGE